VKYNILGAHLIDIFANKCKFRFKRLQMAVPKRKTSPSRRGMRRSHHKLKNINVVVDSVTGEYKLPHHISLVDGTYNNKQVVTQKVEEEIEG
jgi:large subunit ribosomal protein L32